MGCGITQKKPLRKKLNSLNSTEICLKSFIKASPDQAGVKFKLHRQLGSGSFSSVFLCSNRVTNQFSALKVINKSCLSSEMLEGKLKIKEASIMRELDHPNIIRCFELYEDPKRFIISEELIAGGTLIDYLKSVNFILSEEKVATIMHQILSGIAYCHERHIVHRDIKLENVFVSCYSNLLIKIGDFGCATLLGNGKTLSGMNGTYVYMAPEVFDGDYDEKCDIWSCGVIMYILLTGRVPYKPMLKSDLINSIKAHPLRCDTEEFEEFPKDQVSFLRELLAINPKKRLSAREALSHDWLQKHLKESLLDHINIMDLILSPLALSTLQKVACMYLNTFMSDAKNLSEITKYFRIIDKDGNGVVDKQEILSELRLKYSENEAFGICERFFEKYDLNGNGVIEFIEFTVAMCEKKSLLSTRNIERFFVSIDVKNNGFVTFKEIEEFTCVEYESLVKDLKGEFDRSSQISLEKFIEMIRLS